MFGRKNNQTYPGPLPGSNRAGVSSDEILERLAQDYMNDRKWRRFFKFLVLGLVDEFGSLGSVARDVIGQETIVDYTYRPGFFEQLTQDFGASVGMGIVNALGLNSTTIR